jgi:hypothetical protein
MQITSTYYFYLQNFWNQEHKFGQVQWLTPVILATQEAEIGGLSFEASPGK